MRVTGRTLSGTFIAALAVFVAAMALAPARRAATASATAAAVAFVGDSNEQLAMPVVNSLLPNQFAPLDLTRPGTGVRGLPCTHPCHPSLWADMLRSTDGATGADAYVVDLGINDTPQPGTVLSVGYSYYNAKVDWLMRLFAGKPVLWTNLPCAIEPSNLRAGCAVVNSALATAAHRWPNLTVLDWATLAEKHPEWVAGSYGGIHLWPAGQQAWASLVLHALDRTFGISLSR